MSNCVVGSGGFRLPGSIVAQHSVECCDHLSHHGDDDNFGLFVASGEAIMEGFECGVVSAGTEGGHVENVTDLHSATIDTAMSLELAAVEVVGGKPDECGDLLAAHLSEFWQQGDQRERKYRADAGHRDQHLIPRSESGISGDHVRKPFVEEMDIGLQSSQATLAETPQRGIFKMGRLVLDSDMLVAQWAPHRHDLGEPLRCFVPRYNSWRHDR